METETKTPTQEATPAPVAGTAAPAPETKPEAQANSTPAPETKAAPGPKDAPKPDFFYKQREEKREKKAQERVAELEKELETLRKAQPEKPKAVESPEPAEPSFLDDPDGWAKHKEAQFEKRALEAYDRREQERQAVAQFVQAGEAAEKYLLTRSHLKEDPNAQSEIAKLINEKYIHLADFNGGKDPQAAAELAYVAWCRSKGVVPDMDGFTKPTMNATAGRTSSGVPPTAPAVGERTWTKRDAEAYLLEAAKTPAMFKARSLEIEKARSEGRVK